MRRTQEAAKQCKKGCLIIYVGAGEANLTADQKLYERMTASSRNVKTSYVTVKTTSKTEIKLENKEQSEPTRKHWKRRERNQ